VCCLISDELCLISNFSVNTVAMLCSVDLLYCVTETIQVMGGSHVGQPCLKNITGICIRHGWRKFLRARAQLSAKKILSRTIGDFEEQNKVLEPSTN